MRRGRDDLSSRESGNSRRRNKSQSRSPVPTSMSRERESQGRGSKKQEFVHNKEEANFQTSGVLVKEANTFNGVTLKYSEPAEGRKWPSTNKHLLRLYVFKADSHIDTIPLHKQSAYLLGRERRICDIGFDHASISSQHCVLQYRQVVKQNEYGETTQTVKLYIIDLESSNGWRCDQIGTLDERVGLDVLRKMSWKVGDTIPLGELDDSALIESWDMALKEYNAFYSIDPNVRNQQIHHHHQLSPPFSFHDSETNTASPKKRKARKLSNRTGKQVSLSLSSNEPLERQDFIIKDGSSKFSNVKQQEQHRQESVFDADLVVSTLLPKVDSPCLSSSEQFAFPATHTSVEHQLVGRLLDAYRKGYSHYTNDKRVQDPMMAKEDIEKEAMALFPRNFLLQSWYTTGAVTARAELFEKSSVA